MKCGEYLSEPIPELRIVDDEIFEAAQKLLRARSSAYCEHGGIPRHTLGGTLLSGNIYCAHCGGRLTATTNPKKYKNAEGTTTVTRIHRYACYNKVRHRALYSGQSGYGAVNETTTVRAFSNGRSFPCEERRILCLFIVRRRPKNYTVMSNYHLRDKRLTLKAKGLLSVMLSLPNKWDYTLQGLACISVEKVDAIRGAVLELERAGYIVRSRSRNRRRELKETEYAVYEKPRIGFADVRKPITENPATEKSCDGSSCAGKPCIG